MKLKKLNIIALSLLAFIFSGCDSFLDPEKDGKMNEEDVWNNYTQAFQFLNNAYNYLPNGYNRISNAMLASACDEAVHSDVTSGIKGFHDGTWGPYNLVENVWDKNYDGIRVVNKWLENCENIVFPVKPTITGTQEDLVRTRDRMKGEAYFLRAYFYFELIKRYGGVPLFTDKLDIDEAKSQERASYNRCVQQILADLELAFGALPVNYVDGDDVIKGFNEMKDKGRPTQGAALALKARVLLYWASPLNNPDNDMSRYQAVVETTEKLKRLEGVKYGLVDLESNTGYLNVFVSQTNTDRYNKEILFSTKYNSENGYERNNSPISLGGRGYTGPSQNMVDAFGMADGTDFDWNNPVHAAAPYENRDPRFYMNIAYNGMDFKMNMQSTTIETFAGGKDAAGAYTTSTRTGYYLKKAMSKDVVWDGGTANSVNRTWPLIRYAEVLLNYAEALNEMLPAPDKRVYNSIEEIRKRAGLTPYRLNPSLTKDEMRKVIRKERRVELAFEEHRFFDIRRWKLFDEPEQRNDLLKIRGMEIIKEGEHFTYNPNVVIEEREFDNKMYLYPISQYEIIKTNNQIEQNPGW